MGLFKKRYYLDLRQPKIAKKIILKNIKSRKKSKK